MATTQIKNGFQGGSDDQLKVNPDGSINVVTGGSGGNNVNITAVGGNPVTTTLPVSIGGFSSLSPGYPTQVAVGITSVIIIASNPLRKYAHVANNSGAAIYIQYAVSAALNQGVKISPGGFFTLEIENLWTGDVNAIGLVSGQLIDVLEGI